MKRMPKYKFTPRTKPYDFTRRLEYVVSETNCLQHDVDRGDPCWEIESEIDGARRWAICNVRARKIFVGQISELSLRNKRPAKEHTR